MKLCVECHTHYDDVSEACPADGSGLVEVGNDPMIGQTIGDRYRILHVLGKGSMGIVYKGIQLSSGREMAVKFLLRNTGSVEAPDATVKRFQREAKTLSSLKHPNIVTLFDFGFSEDKQPYLVTEFLHGLTLTQLLKESGHLDPRKSMPAFRQVCEAVTEA
ncbi:MAG: serine/threonine protein kinase, partial [Terriglobales bacterium]